MSNQYSQSQQNFYQQPNQQQQWLAYQQQQQQQQNPQSMNNLMTAHQKQWQEYQQQNQSQQFPQQQNNAGSSINLNQQNNYAMWQKQYQARQNNACSNMNMQNYQIMQQQQQAYAMQQQEMQQMKQQIAQSQRALFQQQARNNVNNMHASTGQLSTGYTQRPVNANPNFLSQNAIYDRKTGKLEEDEEMDYEHETFVPPAPQNRQEVEKYVNWQAKRKGVAEQKKIDAQIQTREKMNAMNTEKEKKMEFKNVKKNSFTEPLLASGGHKDSDIDYLMTNAQKEKSSGGCCCVVM